MTKDELIIKINNKYLGGNCGVLAQRLVDEIILPRETAMLEEIERPLIRHNGHEFCSNMDLLEQTLKDLHEALSIIQRRKGEK
jgi:hypothetical protein